MLKILILKNIKFIFVAFYNNHYFKIYQKMNFFINILIFKFKIYKIYKYTVLYSIYVYIYKKSLQKENHEGNSVF